MGIRYQRERRERRVESLKRKRERRNGKKDEFFRFLDVKNQKKKLVPVEKKAQNRLFLQSRED